jgi:RND family efflux transporter MFP subunit
MDSLKNPSLKIPFAIIVALLLLGFAYRYKYLQDAKVQAIEHSVRVVSTINPAFGKGGNSISFPGKLEGYQTAAIYSRVNGYLKSWKKDIGAKVKTGELLGEIESPEVDQQFQQAKSDLVAAISNEELAELSFSRWANLYKVEAVSKQEVDQKTSDLESKKSLRKIAESNLERSTKFISYKNIPAPFDGILTERNTDIGSLISNGGGKPLFIITNIDKLRLYINLPQIYLNDIKVGLSVNVYVPEYPGRVFSANVVRSSGIINPASGSSLVEIEIDNAMHELTAGEFVKVSMELPFDRSLLRVPASCLIIRKNGTFLAEVDQGNKINFKQVKVIRDFGQDIEITGEFTESSLIVNTPSDTLIDGEVVKIAPSKIKNSVQTGS